MTEKDRFNQAIDTLAAIHVRREAILARDASEVSALGAALEALGRGGDEIPLADEVSAILGLTDRFPWLQDVLGDVAVRGVSTERRGTGQGHGPDGRPTEQRKMIQTRIRKLHTLITSENRDAKGASKGAR